MLKKDELRGVEIPQLKTLSAEMLYRDYVMQRPGIAQFFPDPRKGMIPERDFIIDVLSTVMHDELVALVRLHLVARADKFKENYKDDRIEILPEILAELRAKDDGMPPSRTQRGLHRMKKKEEKKEKVAGYHAGKASHLKKVVNHPDRE